MSGYNEDAYRQARQTAIDLPCPFERALLSRCVACFKARKLLLAEREAIACSEREANAACKAFHEALHRNARFALHMDPAQPWPFGKEIRAQCGGVLGLRDALEQGAEIEADVAALMHEGIAKFGDVERFPYSAIMRAVAHYEPRRRRDR
ncbi:MAG: hypothetical protein FJ209_12915 [Betaproteobacteria bacterium]|nr:hypothetical protein [Betaproteobacteria bacterium]